LLIVSFFNQTLIALECVPLTPLLERKNGAAGN
jgi:hypothetical protein